MDSRIVRWVDQSDACDGEARRSASLLRVRARSNSSTVANSRSSKRSRARAAFVATTEELWVRISRISATVSSIISRDLGPPAK